MFLMRDKNGYSLNQYDLVLVTSHDYGTFLGYVLPAKYPNLSLFTIRNVTNGHPDIDRIYIDIPETELEKFPEDEAQAAQRLMLLKLES